MVAANTSDSLVNALFMISVRLFVASILTLIVNMTMLKTLSASFILRIIKHLMSIVGNALKAGTLAFQKVRKKAKFFASLPHFYLLECRSIFSQVKN
jgi:hypothetical protein